MDKKKRLPIEQLREAGKTAHQMLIDKGILAKESVIDKMMKNKKAPRLPGIPPYIPHLWTIQMAQQVMYDLLIIWREENRDDKKRMENITEFFKFVVKEMRLIEKKYDKEMKKMPRIFKSMKKVPVIKDIFDPMRRKENTHAIHWFFVDTFALAITLKNNHTVGEYVSWVHQWTEDLKKVWVIEEVKKEAIK